MDNPKWRKILIGNSELKRLGIAPNDLLIKRLRRIGNNPVNFALAAEKEEAKEPKYPVKVAVPDMQDQKKEREDLAKLSISIMKHVGKLRNQENLIRGMTNRVRGAYTQLRWMDARDGLVRPFCVGGWNFQPIDDTHFIVTTQDMEKFRVWLPPVRSRAIRWDATKANPETMGLPRYDALIADPPWKQAPASSTRGLSLPYPQLSDAAILQIPLGKYARGAPIFLWVVNNKIPLALEWLDKNGYAPKEWITWVKRSSVGSLRCTQGKHLLHAHELCIMATPKVARKKNVRSPRNHEDINVIVADRRKQSQKPEELYHIVENMFPHGRFLELFGRRHNMRAEWDTLGNEFPELGSNNEEACMVEWSSETQWTSGSDALSVVTLEDFDQLLFTDDPFNKEADKYWNRPSCRDWRSASSGKNWRSTDSDRDWRSASSGKTWRSTDSARDWRSTDSDKDWSSNPSQGYNPKNRRKDPFISQVKNLARKGALMSPDEYKSWRDPSRQDLQREPPYRGKYAREPISPWSEWRRNNKWESNRSPTSRPKKSPTSRPSRGYSPGYPVYTGRAAGIRDRAYSVCVTASESPSLRIANCLDKGKNYQDKVKNRQTKETYRKMEAYFTPIGAAQLTKQETKAYLNSAAPKSSICIQLLQPGTPMLKGGKGEEDTTRLNVQVKVGQRKTIDLLDVPCLVKEDVKGIHLGAEVLRKLEMDPEHLLESMFRGKRRNHVAVTIGATEVQHNISEDIEYLGGEEFYASAGEPEEKPLSNVKEEPKTGEWSPEEDLQMWRQISLHGNQWALMAAGLPGRHADQVKHRGKDLLQKYAGFPRRVGNLSTEEVRRRNKSAAKIRLGSLIELPRSLGTPTKRRESEAEVATNSRQSKKIRKAEKPDRTTTKKVRVLLKTPDKKSPKKKHKSASEDKESSTVKKLKMTAPDDKEASIVEKLKMSKQAPDGGDKTDEGSAMKKLAELTAMIQALASQGILKLPSEVEECSVCEADPEDTEEECKKKDTQEEEEVEQEARTQVSEQVSEQDNKSNAEEQAGADPADKATDNEGASSEN